MNHKKIILLFGPTASRKSRLAVDIAKKYNGEIVNADSMQIYREIRILSARPNEKIVKHHLYGFISVKKNFSVGIWHKLAAKKIKKIIKKKKRVVVVGGTGLYFKVLTEGLSEIPRVPKLNLNLNHSDRSRLRNIYNKKYPGIFKGVQLNDKQRFYRAIAIYKHTGIALWKWYKKKNKKKFFKSNEFIKIYLNPPKPELEKRIKLRFEEMLKNGAIKEAENFKKLNLDLSMSSNFIIGIREISDLINKKITMKELKEKVLIRSRQYAKRQYTWQRGQMQDWKGFNNTNYIDLRKKVLSYLSKT